MHMRVRLGLATFLTIAAAAAGAHAGKPKSVVDAFAGDIVISTSPLRPAGATEAEMIEDIRSAKVHEIKAREADGELTSWSFHFAAFLDRAPRVTEMSLDVYTADDDRRYITSKRMMGIDPRLRILAGDMSLTEDDGVHPGERYRLVLTGQVGRREVTFATAVVTLR